MRYTNYILSDKPLDFEGVGVIALPTVIFAVPVLVGLLGGAVLMDSGRLLKLKYLLFKKEQRKVKYLKSVVISLDHNESEWVILRAA